MSSSSVARSDSEVNKIENVRRYDQTKSEEASFEEDSYGDESFDEFQEDVRNILDCSDSEETCEKESSSVDNSESDGNLQKDTSELQLIIDTLEKNTKRASSKMRHYNKTFSDDELRDIERGNSILMKKILSNGKRTSQYASASLNGKTWNSTVNRKKRQQEIDQHNLVLLKRIQAIKPFGLSHRK